MKIFLVILPCFLLIQTCYLRQSKNNIPAEKNNNLQPQYERIDFEKQVKPILVKNCSPCHFTGGKMYEIMPFDKDTTLINHSTGILRRIKNEDENKMLKNFVAQNEKSLPESKPRK